MRWAVREGEAEMGKWEWGSFKFSFKTTLRTSLEVQWLGLRASTAGDMGSIPGQGTKNPQAARHSQKN